MKTTILAAFVVLALGVEATSWQANPNPIGPTVVAAAYRAPDHNFYRNNWISSGSGNQDTSRVA
jgi:hypothetical protein